MASADTQALLQMAPSTYWCSDLSLPRRGTTAPLSRRRASRAISSHQSPTLHDAVTSRGLAGRRQSRLPTPAELRRAGAACIPFRRSARRCVNVIEHVPQLGPAPAEPQTNWRPVEYRIARQGRYCRRQQPRAGYQRRQLRDIIWLPAVKFGSASTSIHQAQARQRHRARPCAAVSASGRRAAAEPHGPAPAGPESINISSSSG